jgi:hypothetical protein
MFRNDSKNCKKISGNISLCDFVLPHIEKIGVLKNVCLLSQEYCFAFLRFSIIFAA